MLRIAFKEWAVICRALALGKQALILRKGGIAETSGEFRPEHSQFWLYPTFVHQQETGIQLQAIPWLREAEADRPPPGMIRLSHFAEIAGAYWVQQLAGLVLIDHLHCWSPVTVEQRFHYRSPGLYVLPVRVYQVEQPIELPVLPAYEGCKTWVELERELPTTPARPVLDDTAFADLLLTLQRRLTPMATV